MPPPGQTPKRPLTGARAFLDEGLSWGPAIDGDLLTQSTHASIAAGVGADKPLVLGTTDDEFTMVTGRAEGTLRFVPPMLALGGVGLSRATRHAYLAANRPQVRKGTAALIGRFVTDHVFRTDVVRIADARGDAATWAYRFSWPSPTRTWALHCLDVPFWFDCLDAPGVATLAGDAPPARARRCGPRGSRRLRPRRRARLGSVEGRHDARLRRRPVPARTAARRLRERARAGLIGARPVRRTAHQ